MHNDTMARGVLLLATAALLAACADESPVQPGAKVPEGGVKSITLGINILPAGQQFPAKVAFVGAPPRLKGPGPFG